MKIVADAAIPLVAEAFRDLGEVEELPGREITAARLRDCRCLVVRTVTRVDAALLENTPVEFVASATIGTDHVDLEYLQQAGIAFANAPGCNAEAAAEYVVSGLFEISVRKGFDPLRRRAGIVGFGQVGSRLQRILKTLGIDCRVCDPPLAAVGVSEQTFDDLQTLLDECDLISLHVPLTHGGSLPTFHLMDADNLARLRPGCLLVNAARGPVVDNAALAGLLRRRDDLHLFLDTWEEEPRVSRELMRRVDLATPHIAGYSVEGRLRGTQLTLDAASAHFGVTPGWDMDFRLPPPGRLRTEPATTLTSAWQALLRAHCDIRRDHEAFVAGADLDDAALASHFDSLRRVYPERREYAHCRVEAIDPLLDSATLRRLGFRIAN